MDKTMWSRSLHPASYTNVNTAQQSLSGLKFPDEFRWLHLLLINRMDQGNGLKQALMLVDIVHPKMPYRDRRAILEKVGPPQLGIRTKPEPNSLHLVPEFSEDILEDLWAALHLMNQDPSWGPYYSGIEARGYDSKYHHQLEDAKKPCLAWHGYPFESLF